MTVRALGGVAVLVALAVLPLASASGAPAAARDPGAVVDRTVRDPRIGESSGLAVSPQHPGVLWTHNDSGNPPVLFALGPDGAVVAAVRVRDVADVDWEAMAAYRDDAGHAVLAVADTGDNAARRSSVQIVLVAEPATLRDATVSPTRVLRLRYPDGPADAEALLVDAEAGRMYVVTKGLGSTVYQVPDAMWPGRPGRAPENAGVLERIATVPLILVTDGLIGPGHHPLLRTYGELAVLPPITADVVGGSLEPLAEAGLPAQRQGEGLALTAAGQVLLSSEGVGQPVLRLPLPAALAAATASPSSSAVPSSPAVSSPAPSSGRAGSASGAGAAPGPSGRADGDGGGVPGVVLLGGGVVAAAVIGALVGRRRVRR